MTVNGKVFSRLLIFLLFSVVLAGSSGGRAQTTYNCYSATTRGAVSEGDCSALVVFYNATDGWQNVIPSWLTSTVGTWGGVRVAGERVTRLRLENKNLTGTIPAELGNLTALTWLFLNGNRLTRTIPSELGNLTSLTHLWLHNNELNGEIPSELGNLTNLTQLQLNNNELSGEIPSELGDLTSLSSLWFNNNELSGEIPSELGNLTSLTYLYLHNNKLSGEIPSELGNLTNLTQLYLHNNELSGEIPSELGNLTNLTSLYLYENKLTGEIPSELGNLRSLTYLFLEGNKLTGEIPAELGDLTSLTYLWLHGNSELSGTLPLGLMDLPLANLDIRCTDIRTPDDASFKSWLAGISFREGCTPPDKPAGLTARVGERQVTLTWYYPNNPTITKYQYKQNNGAWTDIPGSGPDTVSYTVTGLTEATAYVFRIRAVNRAEGGVPSDDVGGKTTSGNLDLRITPESDRLHLRWNAVTGAKIYIVQWRKHGESYNHGVSQGGSPYTITSLEPGTLYDVRVSASSVPGHITYDEKSARTTEGGGVRRPEPEPEVIRPGPVGPTGPTGPVTGPGTTQPQEPPARETSTDTEPSPDRVPLLALYQAAGGENWENKWYTDFPIDDWHGVRTNEDRRVTELDLSGNGLSGETAEEIGELSYLETLDLSGNPDLSGELPLSLSELSNLETLDIRDTGLCVPGNEEFQMWLDGIVFHGEYCTEETADSDGGGCSVSSGKGAGVGAGSALLGLLLVAFVLSGVLRKTASRPG